jgi:transcriptional regulator with XRE-family HTH domain
MMRDAYRECGLDNVVIAGVSFQAGDAGEEVVRIPNVNGLHRAIALGIVTRNAMMSGREMRFLRSQMGPTQPELAAMIHREPLTVSRRERGETDIEANAETVVRLIAIERLGLDVDKKIGEIGGWSVQSAIDKPLVIDGSDPRSYRVRRDHGGKDRERGAFVRQRMGRRPSAHASRPCFAGHLSTRVGWVHFAQRRPAESGRRDLTSPENRRRRGRRGRVPAGGRPSGGGGRRAGALPSQG